MPVELLQFTPLYVVVGAYRLATDESLYKPIWKRSSTTLKKALLVSIPFALISWPLTRLYITLILSRSPFAPTAIHDAQFLGMSAANYVNLTLVFGQISMLIEWMLSRQLKKSREEVYEATVKSRGKSSDWWQGYVEEWKVPPLQRAKRNAEKQAFYKKLSTPLVRIILLKVLLTPVSFIPGVALITLSAIRSLTLARSMHSPLFRAKKMTPLQTELWLVERQTEYRLFGFVCSVVERIPLLGIVFSISNRIGASMWAHDLEKQQEMFRQGKLLPTKSYVSKTAIAAEQEQDLPEDFSGGFPTHKGPIKIAKDGTEIGTLESLEPPPLPPRHLM